jgi:prepilin-type N-terminal cleavage/methylation domain-containing protein
MRKGFSLIETLVVLAAAAVLVYGASSALIGLAPKYRFKKAVWEVQTRLNYARYKAIFGGEPVRVRFLPAGYAVDQYDETKGEWRIDSSGAFEGVAVEANNSPTFHPLGTVSNLATITVSNSWGKCRITLAISGRIRVVML